MDYIDHMVQCPQGATLQLCIGFLRGWVAKELAVMQIILTVISYQSRELCFAR